MMIAKIFVPVWKRKSFACELIGDILRSTGITGYIGGQNVVHLLRKRPNVSVTALVRNERQAAAVKAALPEVNTVIGHLDSVDILARLSAESDIVLQCASADHPVAVAAIIKGIKSKPVGSTHGVASRP
ncbi:unnamed protein product [Penicillium pancosmium]